MKTHRIVCLLCSVCATPLFAASPAPETPVWLRYEGSRPTFLEIFNAFQSKGDPIQVAPDFDASARSLPPAIYPEEFRDINGSGNNRGHVGAAGGIHFRTTTVGYGDGVGTPAGADRRSARDISNIVNAQSAEISNIDRVSSFVWQWGQLVDHDMSLTRVANPKEEFDIAVPTGDPVFDPRSKGNQILPFQRSSHTEASGIREQINANTSFLDGSQVYGSDSARASDLRTLDGTGHLKVGTKNLLPLNLTGQDNQPDKSANFFVAGDVRVNENIGLTALQTLFMREHNFWADSIKAGDSSLDDDGIYFRARAIVGAEIELITYRDFLSILLGPNALSPYLGYNPTTDPRTALVFTTAAFRVGHTFLPPVLQRLTSKLNSLGDIPLGAGFFFPALLPQTGIDPYLRGLARQIPQQVDAHVIDAVRNFLFEKGRAPGFDLASLNIQRGRDHGLPGYNQVRIDYGLAPKLTFAEMTSDGEIQTRLASAYTSPDNVDIWVGGLAEDHVNGGQVGETLFTILKDQFERTRDGDRFWYESYLDATTLATVQAQTLSIIIRRNTSIGTELQDDAFRVPAAAP